MTATIAGAISMIANFGMFFGGGQRDVQSSNPLIGLLVLILAPIAAMLVQLAISRTREYSAERPGGEISGDPLALASALRKLEHGARHIDNAEAEANPATAHMFTINPLSGLGMDDPFATHPNTANRIAELEEQAGRGLAAA